MAKPLDPKKIESARQFSSRAERREQRRKLMQDEIAENQRSNGVIVIPPKKMQEVQQERPKLRVAAYCRVSTQEEKQVGSFIIADETLSLKVFSGSSVKFESCNIKGNKRT